MSRENCPGYFAIIPADVRYDPDLKPAAKLLFGEISALLNKEGFCFASNGYFAELYGVTERTISDSVSKLQKAGYIQVEVIRDQTGQVTRRRIRLSVSTGRTQPVEENFYTHGRNLREGIEENFQYTVTSNTDIKENIKESPSEQEAASSTGKRPRKKAPPIDPKPLFIAWIGKLEGLTPQMRNRLYIAIVRFLQSRTDSGKPMNSGPAVTALCNKLSRYSGGNLNNMLDMLEEATIHSWRSVYPPKNQMQQPADQREENKRWL